MTSEMVESAWARIRYFLYVGLDIRKITILTFALEDFENERIRGL